MQVRRAINITKSDSQLLGMKLLAADCGIKIAEYTLNIICGYLETGVVIPFCAVSVERLKTCEITTENLSKNRLNWYYKKKKNLIALINALSQEDIRSILNKGIQIVEKRSEEWMMIPLEYSIGLRKEKGEISFLGGSDKEDTQKAVRKPVESKQPTVKKYEPTVSQPKESANDSYGMIYGSYENSNFKENVKEVFHERERKPEQDELDNPFLGIGDLQKTAEEFSLEVARGKEEKEK